MAEARQVRPVVFGRGWQFDPNHSTNSNRKPRLFDWTDDPERATVDAVVHLDGSIRPEIDVGRRRIAWMIESPATSEWQGVRPWVREHIDEVAEAYDVFLTCDLEMVGEHPNVRYHPPGSQLPWIPDHLHGLHRKTRMCSMIASPKERTDGHQFRQVVAGRYVDQIDLYGGALGSERIGMPALHPDKRSALLPYRFQICVENTRCDFYYTEKITDCFATGTVPIYWGSDRINDLFDPAGIITLTDDFDPAMLSVGLYQSMMPAIRRNLDAVRRLWSADDLLYARYLSSEAEKADLGTFEAAQWRSVGLDAAFDMPLVDRSDDELLRAALAPKKELDGIGQVPRDMVTVRELALVTSRPRVPPLAHSRVDWYAPQQLASLLHVPDGFIGDNVVFDEHRWYGLGRWWAGHASLYRDVDEVRHVDAAMVISAFGGDAFQHFMVDALPRLAVVIELLESPGWEHVSVASHLAGAEAARWIWSELGLSDRVVQKPRSPDAGFVLHADVVMVPEFEPAQAELGFTPRGSLLPVQQRLGVLDGEPESILYLRRDPGRRGVADEDVLIERLGQEAERAGLELDVRRGGADLEGDRRRTRRARVIVGPHGGAFGNLVFARPGSTVIEFLPIREPFAAGKDVRAMFWGLAQAAGLDYWAVEPDGFGFEAPEMSVDVDRVVDVLRSALS